MLVKNLIEKKKVVVLGFTNFTFNVFNSGVINVRTDIQREL